MTLRRNPTDPFWMRAKFAGECRGPGCGTAFPVGADIFYNPVTKKAFARDCGCGVAAEQRLCLARIEADTAKVRT